MAFIPAVKMLEICNAHSEAQMLLHGAGTQRQALFRKGVDHDRRNQSQVTT